MMAEQDNPFMRGQEQKTADGGDEKKRSYKPRTPNFDQVVAAVERGDYDDQILALHEALSNRREALRARVLEQVRAVYGPEAEIHTTRSPQPAIFRDSTTEAVDEGTDNQRPDGEASDEGASDPLAHLDEVEKKMTAESPEVDIERRGAIISGLHSSQIAE